MGIPYDFHSDNHFDLYKSMMGFRIWADSTRTLMEKKTLENINANNIMKKSITVIVTPSNTI